MKSAITLTQISTTLKKNWFKILVGTLLLMLFLKKDFTIHFNVNSPPAPGTPAQQTVKNKEVFTEQQKTGILSTRQRLGILFSGADNNGKPLLQNIENTPETTKRAYLNRFAHVAVDERKKYGIPSSVILAHGLLMSAAGERPLTARSNNQFAIPCDGTWTGATDHEDGQCYRSYDSAWASFRDHSIYLTSGKYATLRNLHARDYKGWIHGLQQRGFSKAPDYEKAMLQIIEQFQLQILDQQP